MVIGGRDATARRAIIGRPGAPSRQGEEDAVAAALAGRFPLTRLIPPATLEGGDVLILPDRVVVGRSGRTNAAGIAQLAVALAGTGLPVYAAPVESYLHLLTAVTYLGQGVLLAIEGWPLPRATGRSGCAARAAGGSVRGELAGHRRACDRAGRPSAHGDHAASTWLRYLVCPHVRVRQSRRRRNVSVVGVVRLEAGCWKLEERGGMIGFLKQ